ncbi:MAG: VOC family protein [Phycisphaerales bacterium]|nr:VOC family protein [Phycisphaerales bacterium]
MAKVKAIPDGFHTVTAHMVVTPAKKAIDFYKKAFGAEEIMCMPGPDGKSVMHAEIKIGNSHIMLNDEFPGMDYMKSPSSAKCTTVTMHLYVEDVDKSYDKAVKAGAKPSMPIMDMFWGDRYGKVTDPFGHEWSLATHKEDVSPEECGKRAAAWMKGQGCG